MDRFSTACANGRFNGREWIRQSKLIPISSRCDPKLLYMPFGIDSKTKKCTIDVMRHDAVYRADFYQHILIYGSIFLYFIQRLNWFDAIYARNNHAYQTKSIITKPA